VRRTGGRLADIDVRAIGYYRFARGTVARVSTLVSRTGYTGEDGFELYARAVRRSGCGTRSSRGDEDGVAPIGLGARDTLRLEMRYALYGNDIDETTNPLEAGLGWVVKPPRAISSAAPRSSGCAPKGPKRKLVGIEMRIARWPVTAIRCSQAAVESASVTSARSVRRWRSRSRWRTSETPLAAIGTAVDVEIRGQARRLTW
jgi:aminomethyltransferase